MHPADPPIDAVRAHQIGPITYDILSEGRELDGSVPEGPPI
ncbi:MAG: hypothetical protein RLZZ621_2004, partial [Gemmatimonadota bacterium]